MNFEDGGVTLSDVPCAVDRALSEDFPFDEVADRLDHTTTSDLPDSMYMASECMRRIFSWIWQGDCKDLDGFKVRSVIACWVFVPQLRSYSMTEMAGRVGLKKQSLGRWVDDFKREFPQVTNYLQHIKHE